MADVICPNCNERYHETTDKYNPNIAPNGTMFRLKGRYREWGWDSFIEDESSIQDNLFCPECGGLYCEHGKVRVDGWVDPKVIEAQAALDDYSPELPEAKTDKVPCPYCGEMFHKRGLAGHIRFKHPGVK